jgi:hypothetical protein
MPDEIAAAFNTLDRLAEIRDVLRQPRTEADAAQLANMPDHPYVITDEGEYLEGYTALDEALEEGDTWGWTESCGLRDWNAGVEYVPGFWPTKARGGQGVSLPIGL